MARNRTITLATVASLDGRDGDYHELVMRDVGAVDERGSAQLSRSIVRTNGIDSMRGKGSISDAQYGAHLRYRDLYDGADSAKVKALDYGRIRVDGGARGLGSLDRYMHARDQLAAIRTAIGAAHADVLDLMSGQGLSLDQARQRLPANDRDQPKKKSTVSTLVKEALDRLDVHWNGTGSKPRGVRAEAYGERATMDAWREDEAGKVWAAADA